MKSAIAAVALLGAAFVGVIDPEGEVLERLRAASSHASVPPALFEQLGWELPEGGRHVRTIADAAPGGAFDPRALEGLRHTDVGYSATWHVVRYPHYGLDWDITGLRLMPRAPVAGLPTIVFINGGSANWYEFFVDPLNGPAVGQYLAQKVPVLLVSIPGNYRDGGWEAPIAARKPAYLLDRELDEREVRARNVIMTFSVVAEGVRRIVETATTGPVLIAGHSTGGEIQFLLRDALRSRLNGLSLGWGTGGPAALRRAWQDDAAAVRNRGRFQVQDLQLAAVRERTPEEYARSYIGPLNPLGPPSPTGFGESGTGSKIAIAKRWFERENRRRPQFKQPIQDIEHRGEREYLDALVKAIRLAVRDAGLRVDPAQIEKDLFSTMRTPLSGYRRMIWTTAAGDDGHWDADLTKARELFVAETFRKANPEAQIRVLVFDVPMSHYGHIEKPRQLAGGILAAVKWLYQ
jgi:hypothetical protein